MPAPIAWKLGWRLGLSGFITILSALISAGLLSATWKEVRNTVQAVDQRMLAGSLPQALSPLLRKGRAAEVQKMLDTTEGYFGLVVTDSRSLEAAAPGKRILFATRVAKRDADRTWNDDLSVRGLVGKGFVPIYSDTDAGQRSPSSAAPIARLYFLPNDGRPFLQDILAFTRSPFQDSATQRPFALALLFGLSVGGICLALLNQRNFLIEQDWRASLDKEASIRRVISLERKQDGSKADLSGLAEKADLIRDERNDSATPWRYSRLYPICRSVHPLKAEEVRKMIGFPELSGGQITCLEYSDRYFDEQSAGVMMDILCLANILGAGSQCRILTSSRLKDRSPDLEQKILFKLEALEESGVETTVTLRRWLPHKREMKVTYFGGRKLTLLFDKGIGFIGRKDEHFLMLEDSYVVAWDG